MLRVVETFSGIGSQAKALQKLGIEHKVVNTVEWDIAAFYAYDIIHNGVQDLSEYQHLSKDEILRILSKYGLSIDGKNPLKEKSLAMWPVDSLKRILCALNRTRNLGSITNVTCDMLPKKIDLLTYSFPCQDLSICGSWHGNMTGINRDAHNRSGMLWEVERILKEMRDAGRRLPKFLLMENVSNILSKAHRENFAEWKEFLEELGYFNKVYTLNASNFGSPQKRVGTYMLSVLCADKSKRKKVEKYFKEHNLEEQPPLARTPLINYLRVNYNIPKYKKEADISNTNDTPSRRKIFRDNDIVYDGTRCISDTVNTLTTKQDRHPTAGMVLYPEHATGKSEYRNFTPRECFLLMGFDERDYEILFRNNIQIKKNHFLYSKERCEKLAGNSIVVDVLMAIFRQIDEIDKNIISRHQKYYKKRKNTKK